MRRPDQRSSDSLAINRPGNNGVGLFGFTNGATLRNVGFGGAFLAVNERNLRNVRGRQVAMHRREVGVERQEVRVGHRLQLVGHVVPRGDLRVAFGELGVGRDHAELLLLGEKLLQAIDRGVLRTLQELTDLVQQARNPVFIATPEVSRLDDVATQTYRGSPEQIASA